jgi:alkanesulfonate monooxygenase SsuD/methylene tetrahydromethanopterin reductase-like flavin-dependent oxidoreductase (luciferase family)
VPAVTEEPDDLRLKLGIKPGHKVCLFHARKYLLPVFIKGDLKLMLDWAEEGCDAVLYWLQPQDDVEDFMPRLAQQIKKNGRIWLIMPKKDIAVKQGFKQSWQEIQQIVLDVTNLVDTKTLSIGDGEYGTQFVFRKTAREEAQAETTG